MDSHPTIVTDSVSPEDRIVLARVREVVGCLDKTVKAFLLYPPSNPLPAEFKAELFGMLTSLLDEHGALELSIHGDALYHGKEKLRKDAAADGFAASLTRDGIVKLTFRPGLTSAELDRFLAVVRKAVKQRSDGDDLATLLWEASLESISYESVGGLEAIDYEAAERGCAAHLAKRRQTAGHVDADAISGAQAKPRRMSALVRSVEGSLPLDILRGEAAQFDPLASTLSIFGEVLAAEEDVPAFRRTCDALDELYDRFIAQADFESARRVGAALLEFELAAREREAERFQRLGESRIRTIDGPRIEQLCRALNTEKDCDLDACRRLLSEMPAPALHGLVAALGVLERRAARDMFCGLLVERGKQDVDAIASGLSDARWYVARNVAFVLGRIGGARACEHLSQALRHGDERVRREAVAVLARVDSSESRGQLRKALQDDSPELRSYALSALSSRRDVESAALIAKRIRAADFPRVSEAERQDWLSALARIQGDAALPLLRSFIERWGPFLWGARRALRLQAVAALAQGDGPETTAYLQSLTTARGKAVRDAAVSAQQRARLDRGRS